MAEIQLRHPFRAQHFAQRLGILDLDFARSGGGYCRRIARSRDSRSSEQ